MTQESQGEGGEAFPGRRAGGIKPDMIERAFGEPTEVVRARGRSKSASVAGLDGTPGLVIDPEELAPALRRPGQWLLHATPGSPEAIERDDLTPGTKQGVHTEPRAFFQTRAGHVLDVTASLVESPTKATPSGSSTSGTESARVRLPCVAHQNRFGLRRPSCAPRSC